jgi:hypothetical protein
MDTGTDAAGDSATDAATGVVAEAAADADAADADMEAGAPAGSGSWLTEFAGQVQPSWYRDPSGLPGLLDAYAQACVPQAPANPCDGGANDGGDDGGPEAGEEGGASGRCKRRGRVHRDEVELLGDVRVENRLDVRRDLEAVGQQPTRRAPRPSTIGG